MRQPAPPPFALPRAFGNIVSIRVLKYAGTINVAGEISKSKHVILAPCVAVQCANAVVAGAAEDLPKWRRSQREADDSFRGGGEWW